MTSDYYVMTSVEIGTWVKADSRDEAHQRMERWLSEHVTYSALVQDDSDVELYKVESEICRVEPEDEEYEEIARMNRRGHPQPGRPYAAARRSTGQEQRTFKSRVPGSSPGEPAGNQK